jgi:hypothetical protein
LLPLELQPASAIAAATPSTATETVVLRMRCHAFPGYWGQPFVFRSGYSRMNVVRANISQCGPQHDHPRPSRDLSMRYCDQGGRIDPRSRASA